MRAIPLSISSAVAATAAMQAAKPANYKGLEVTPLGIERAQNVPLLDCPPGSNTQRGNARAGEEFAVVTLAFKVTPAFKETIVKKPVLTDADGKVYNTSVAIIDAGSKPEYTCAFPFRVPTGTKVASVAIDTATIDLAALNKISWCRYCRSLNTSPRRSMSVPARACSKWTAATALSSFHSTPTATSSAASTPMPRRSRRRSRRCRMACSRSAWRSASIRACPGTS